MPSLTITMQFMAEDGYSSHVENIEWGGDDRQPCAEIGMALSECMRSLGLARRDLILAYAVKLCTSGETSAFPRDVDPTKFVDAANVLAADWSHFDATRRMQDARDDYAARKGGGA